MDSPPVGSPPPPSRSSQIVKLLIAFAILGVAAKLGYPTIAQVRAEHARKIQAATLKFGPVQNEQTWIVQQIGRDIVDAVEFATNRQTPQAAAVQVGIWPGYRSTKYKLQSSFKGLKPLTTELELTNYLWSPDNFAPWCKTLLTSAKAKIPSGSAGRPDMEYISRLTNPLPELLTREDRRISADLTKDPLSPAAHEEAALLIGSFALRQPNGCFFDIRAELSAMTAHLALAQAIRGQSSVTGELAEAILCSLVGRETPAVEILERLQRTADTTDGLSLSLVNLWTRALKMRVTGDYQRLDQAEHASLLERLEYVRAVRDSINSEAATRFAMSFQLERLSEWSARILEGSSYSVEDGNIWAPRLLRDVVDEISSQYRNYHGRAIGQDDLIAALNAPWINFRRTNEGEVNYEVLGWGGWAQQHQRKLCMAMEITADWLEGKVGLPEDAKKFEKQSTDRFGKLDLFPLINFHCRRDAETDEDFAERVTAVFKAHPERVPLPKWEAAWEFAIKQHVGPPPPAQKAVDARTDTILHQAWIDNNRFLLGTLYDLDNRLSRRHSPFSSVSDPELEALKQMAPSNFAVVSQHLFLVQRQKKGGGPDITTAQFADLSRYNVRAMKEVANAVRYDPVRYRQALERLCRFEPDRFVQLGDYLVTLKDEAGAASAYRKAFEYAPDRVYLANNMEWLVNYCYDHDQKDEAMKIAKYGAEVFSYRGLEIMSKLLERMGKLDEAEGYLKTAEKRYRSYGDLREFYIRNHDKSKKYAEAEEELRQKTFPGGPQRVSLTELHDAPADGVLLAATSARTQKAGLQPNDVFVVVNGYRIHNVEQYEFARAPYDSPKVSFIVWRKDRYVELRDAEFPRMAHDVSRIEPFVNGKVAASR
jgi:hypothetical protein